MLSTRLERILYIDALIEDTRYPSVKTFTEHFEVSERTILNDIQFLKDRLNAPIQYSRFHGGYLYSDLTWRLSTFHVTEGDLLAFFLGVELAHRYLGTSFEKPLRDAIQHLTNMLPAKVQVSISELSSHYSVRSGATAQTAPETLLALQRAIQDRHPVDMVYFTAQRGQETQRVVYPAFSAEYYFGQSFQSEHGDDIVEVILLFDAYQARYIRERTWHASQQIEEQLDGTIIMRFKTGAIQEVQRWVMGYGSHVRVLAPESLAQSVITEFHKTLVWYEQAR